ARDEMGRHEGGHGSEFGDRDRIPPSLLEVWDGQGGLVDGAEALIRRANRARCSATGPSFFLAAVALTRPRPGAKIGRSWCQSHPTARASPWTSRSVTAWNEATDRRPPVWRPS